jgi:molybdate transport system substrate-binding protein
MQAAVDAGRVAGDAPLEFAHNRLVVVFPEDNPAGLEGLEDLANAGLKLVLAAREVPAGQYSLDFLDKAAASGDYGADYKDKVLANVVSYEENVRSVLTKVALGEADGGIVYTSDVTGPDADKVGQIEIPEALNVTATYPMAVIQDSARPALARQFVEFVLSPEGQASLADFGFIPVPRQGDSQLYGPPYGPPSGSP